MLKCQSKRDSGTSVFLWIFKILSGEHLLATVTDKSFIEFCSENFCERKTCDEELFTSKVHFKISFFVERFWIVGCATLNKARSYYLSL